MGALKNGYCGGNTPLCVITTQGCVPCVLFQCLRFGGVSGVCISDMTSHPKHAFRRTDQTSIALRPPPSECRRYVALSTSLFRCVQCSASISVHPISLDTFCALCQNAFGRNIEYLVTETWTQCWGERIGSFCCSGFFVWGNAKPVQTQVVCFIKERLPYAASWSLRAILLCRFLFTNGEFCRFTATRFKKVEACKQLSRSDQAEQMYCLSTTETLGLGGRGLRQPSTFLFAYSAFFCWK